MAKIDPNEIVTQGHRRIFRQPGGSGPDHAVIYAGVSDQYLAIQGVTRVINGGVSPINVPDPKRRKGFKRVGRTIEAGDFSKFDLKLLERRSSIPFALGDLSCEQTLYVPTGTCKDPSNFLHGWDGSVVILPNALPSDEVDIGDLTAAWESDDAQEYTIPHVMDTVYAITSLNFGAQAGPEVDREVVDLVYGGGIECGACGPADNGARRVYAITASSGSGSPGLPAEVVYTTYNPVTDTIDWDEATITGIGANANPSAIEIIGDKLIILVPSEGAYYYATLDATTGVPSSFTKVTSGFVAAGIPHDWYVLDSGNIFICGDAGYIYKLSDVGSAVTVVSAGTITTNNLLRIDGDDEDTIVIVGAANTILKSSNRGATFATTTASPATGTNVLQAVAVVDADRYWVGSNQGYLYWTATGGVQWYEQSFSGSQSGQIYDLLSVSGEVLYMSHSTSTPTARIFATWNGGRSWTNQAPRIKNLPTFNRATRLAAPRLDSQALTVASNNLAVGGLSGGGTDGILLLGIGNIV